MKILNNNKINLQVLKKSIASPEIFEKGTGKFWNDEYISGQMLAFHLDPDSGAASKTKETIEAETAFIIKMTAMDDVKTVLDLGCGPGLYAREFAKTGAKITGIDLSARSINYADENIKPANKNTMFTVMNYLNMNFKKSFDIATLIFYDFCALSTDEQKMLLVKIHEALKDNGIFIFDVVTENRRTPVSTSISVCEGGGFWSSAPYIEILNTTVYEEPKTEGLQYTIIDENGAVKITRLYHRLFGLAEITKLLADHHFQVEKVYKNLKGEALCEGTETYGIFARKA